METGDSCKRSCSNQQKDRNERATQEKVRGREKGLREELTKGAKNIGELQVIAEVSDEGGTDEMEALCNRYGESLESPSPSTCRVATWNANGLKTLRKMRLAINLMQASAIEHFHCCFETLIFETTENGTGGHAAVFKDHIAGVRTFLPHLLVVLAE